MSNLQKITKEKENKYSISWTTKRASKEKSSTNSKLIKHKILRKFNNGNFSVDYMVFVWRINKTLASHHINLLFYGSYQENLLTKFTRQSWKSSINFRYRKSSNNKILLAYPEHHNRAKALVFAYLFIN